MPRLSVVIPACDRFDLMEQGLVSLLQNRPADCEIIVVVNRPYEDPYELHDEVHFVLARTAHGAAECLNVGVATATAPIVHVLAPGVEVEDGWAYPVYKHFVDPKVAAVAPLVLDTAKSRVVTAGVGYFVGGRRKDILRGKLAAKAPAKAQPVLGPSRVAAFYRREALAALSQPFDPNVGDSLTDVDLALRLRQAGWQAMFEPASRIVCEAPLAVPQPCFASGKEAERVFWRNRFGAALPVALLAHTAVVAGDCCRAVVAPRTLLQLAGRICACLEWGANARATLRLQQDVLRARDVVEARIAAPATGSRLVGGRTISFHPPAGGDASVPSPAVAGSRGARAAIKR